VIKKILTPGPATLGIEVQVSQPDGGVVTLPSGSPVKVIWSSKRWAECEAEHENGTTKFKLQTAWVIQ